MHCIDPNTTVAQAQATRRVLLLGGVVALAGCATRRAAEPPSARPAPASAPAARPAVTAPVPAPAPAPSANGLPQPVAARNWDEFRTNAGRRLVAAHPNGSYMSRPPDMLFGIPVIETELNADGSVKSIAVLRRPADASAGDTVQLAADAIHRAAPYGDMSRLPKPWKWVETFLFNDQRQFKPRSLD